MGGKPSHKTKGAAFPREWTPWVAVPSEWLQDPRLPPNARAVAQTLHLLAIRAWQSDPNRSRGLDSVTFRTSASDLARLTRLSVRTVDKVLARISDPRDASALFVCERPGQGGRRLRNGEWPEDAFSVWRAGPAHPWHGDNTAKRHGERVAPLATFARRHESPAGPAAVSAGPRTNPRKSCGGFPVAPNRASARTHAPQPASAAVAMETTKPPQGLRDSQDLPVYGAGPVRHPASLEGVGVTTGNTCGGEPDDGDRPHGRAETTECDERRQD